MGGDGRIEVRIPAGIDAAAWFERARRRAADSGVEIEGDAKGGRFSGVASGTYEVHGDVLSIAVLKKPVFVPLSLVRTQIERAFAGL